MKTKEAMKLGGQILESVLADQFEAGYAHLAPVLAKKTPFPMLERIGKTIGAGSPARANPFMDHIAEHQTMGGWVVIGGVLNVQLLEDLPGAFSRAKKFIIAADTWYGTDILGERVPGPGLVTHFEDALTLLQFWRDHPNRWIRRAVGVAVHFWAKRSKGNPDLDEHAASLINLLEPMFSEWEMDAVKGVGWGLKTMGRYYPELMADWLPKQIHRKHRTIMLKKAMKFITEEQRIDVKHKDH